MVLQNIFVPLQRVKRDTRCNLMIQRTGEGDRLAGQRANDLRPTNNGRTRQRAGTSEIVVKRCNDTENAGSFERAREWVRIIRAALFCSEVL